MGLPTDTKPDGKPECRDKNLRMCKYFKRFKKACSSPQKKLFGKVVVPNKDCCKTCKGNSKRDATSKSISLEAMSTMETTGASAGTIVAIAVFSFIAVVAMIAAFVMARKKRVLRKSAAGMSAGITNYGTAKDLEDSVCEDDNKVSFSRVVKT